MYRYEASISWLCSKWTYSGSVYSTYSVPLRTGVSYTFYTMANPSPVASFLILGSEPWFSSKACAQDLVVNLVTPAEPYREVPQNFPIAGLNISPTAWKKTPGLCAGGMKEKQFTVVRSAGLRGKATSSKTKSNYGYKDFVAYGYPSLRPNPLLIRSESTGVQSLVPAFDRRLITGPECGSNRQGP